MPKPKKIVGEDVLPDEEEVELPTTISPAGSIVQLMSQEEVAWYDDVKERYVTENKFSNVSDLLELDRILYHEITYFRWMNWILMGKDYNGNPIMATLAKDAKEYSREIRELKTGLGIDKKTRDKDKGSSIADLWENLQLRAKEFGVHRNEQTHQAIVNFKEIQALVTLHKNSTPVERTKYHSHEADIIARLEEMFIEFDAIDTAFRLNQSVWIRGELN